MKRMLYVATVVGATLAGPAVAQAPASLSELYGLAMLYPESFDQYVANNQSELQARFSSCLAGIVNANWGAAQVEVQQCNAVAGYGKAYMDCINNTPASSATLGAMTMYQVLNGQLLWRDSMYGQNALVIKNIAPQVGLNYQALINYYVEMAQPYLQC